MKHGNVIASVLIVAALFGFGGYRYYLLDQELKERNELFAATVADFQNRVAELEGEIGNLKTENQNLVTELIEQVGKNELITGELKGLADIVSNFEKLSKLDPELLQKYSKIYFLNENYTPSGFTAIDPMYLLRPEPPAAIHTNVWPFLEKLLRTADEQSVPLKVISGYRSFGEQSSLKSTYRVTYGAGTANQFSADQGYSEHQLGTTVDFTTPDIGTGFTKFESTLGYTWLLAHAHEYGFILSYPKGNQYYIFEPWHWRFVGVELATKLKNEGKAFYDIDQRTIDEYLIKIFD